MDDVLWAYQISFKTPIRMSPYRIVFGKVYHRPFEPEHKDYWAIQKLNFDTKAFGEKKVVIVEWIGSIETQCIWEYQTL